MDYLIPPNVPKQISIVNLFHNYTLTQKTLSTDWSNLVIHPKFIQTQQAT